jgi:hypothetical protein
MHLRDHPIEAKLKPVQELKCSDFGVLWVGDVLTYYKKEDLIS